jgi:flavin reductase (DIM6/NTAB) family NADH-FMN oxidoreductase RutF
MRQLQVADALNYLYPQPLAFLSVTAPDGARNAMAVGWLMQASFEPPMLAVAVSPRNYTHRLIEQTNAFALSFAGEGQGDLINRLGSVSSSGEDKLRLAGVEAIPGTITGCPMIVGAAVHFECQVDRRMTTGDHSVFFARIVAAWVPEAPVQKIDNFGSQRYGPVEPVSPQDV